MWARTLNACLYRPGRLRHRLAASGCIDDAKASSASPSSPASSSLGLEQTHSIVNCSNSAINGHLNITVRFIAVTMLVILSPALEGCGRSIYHSTLRPVPETVSNVDHITMLSLPVAINFDHIPGPDGLNVQVYLFRVDRAQPVTVNRTLEFLLFEQRVAKSELADLEPFGIWSFSGADLARHLSRSIVGWGYAMELRWDHRPPKSRTVTLAVRYRPPQGPDVYSDPIVISVGQK